MWGVTLPLIVNEEGNKFGKSAGAPVWLDPSLTSPFNLYQFFLRLPDRKAPTLTDSQMMPLLLLHCISDVTSYSFVNRVAVAVVKVGAIVRLGRCCDTSPSCLPRRSRIFWTVTRSSRRSDKLRPVWQGESLLSSNHHHCHCH